MYLFIFGFFNFSFSVQFISSAKIPKMHTQMYVQVQCIASPKKGKNYKVLSRGKKKLVWKGAKIIHTWQEDFS